MKRITLLLMLLATVAHAQATSTTLTWTATGDDGRIGTATSYTMRYAATAPGADTLAWFTGATNVPGLPAPTVAGTTQSVTVTPAGGFAAGSWHFILIAYDDAGNKSPWSNVLVRTFGDVIPPGVITDLR